MKTNTLKSNIEGASWRIQEVKKHQLPELDLSRLYLTEIPKEVFELRHLEILTLGKWTDDFVDVNRVTHLPPEIGNLVNLKELFLSENRLSFLPPAIGKLRNLRSLILASNKLSQLPPEIGSLKNLQFLVLAGNQLSSLPSQLGKLEKLKVLYISDNQLSNLPIEVGNLLRIEEMYLQNNQLTGLPPEIGKLVNLKRLDLGNNLLAHLPIVIGDLVNLSRLDLHSNHLSHLPAEIGKLVSLHRLDLQENHLATLPSEIGKLKQLTSLELDRNNEMISPPQSVIQQGAYAIQRYFEELTEKTKVWTSKMVIVGEGGVGKTCLLDSIEDKEFIPNRDTTHGIEVRIWDLPHPVLQSTMMKLRVWDFGGQDIYHATHQFYLTNHSLFLLVWNARAGFESGKIYKWLETIRALAPDSPIFIIATHSKERGADLPKGDIENLYPGRVQFFEVDNADKSGINTLKTSIRKATLYLKYMGVERPKCWVSARDAVVKSKKRCLSKKELFS